MKQMTLSKKDYVSMSKIIPVVEIKTVTWDKESHNLFDYDNSYYDLKKFVLGSSANLIRRKNEVNIVETDEEITADENLLLSITKQEKSHDYFLNLNRRQLMDKEDLKTFLVIRSMKEKDGKTQKGFKLNAGSIFKLGRMYYRVSRIKTDFSTEAPQKLKWYDCPDNESIYDYDNLSDIEPKSARDVCKYCFSEEITDNPLDNLILKPCDCSGSAGMVHFRCLKEWIKCKVVEEKIAAVTYFQWDRLQCEICLCPFPSKIKYNNELHDFVTLEQPTSPHIVLENIGDDQRKSTFILIKTPEAIEIKMGRARSCEVLLKDISISRVHSIMKYNGNSFKIYDNESKFGTLVEVNKDIPISSAKAAVQVGRTVFTFVMKKMPIGYFGSD